MSEYAPDTAETLETIAQFVSETPPGELSQVLHDIRGLVNNDSLVSEAIAHPLSVHNTNTLAVVTVDGSDASFIVSKFNALEGNRFVDPNAKLSYAVDHLAQTASDPVPHESNNETEEHRAALNAAINTYTQDHYPNGHCAVFSHDNSRTLNIGIVSNKFNPNNFWNGRWISQWTANLDSDEISGELFIHVHYYEDGNVQVKTTKHATAKLASIPSDPVAFASAVVAQMLKIETEYQLALNASYAQISDSTFKSLRRALPITRTKLDWNSVSNYKIGAELSNK
ncbi:capping protein muscle Z-line, alpha 2, partial [Chytriomyces cf. hyalinus JEL632]